MQTTTQRKIGDLPPDCSDWDEYDKMYGKTKAFTVPQSNLFGESVIGLLFVGGWFVATIMFLVIFVSAFLWAAGFLWRFL